MPAPAGTEAAATGTTETRKPTTKPAGLASFQTEAKRGHAATKRGRAYACRPAAVAEPSNAPMRGAGASTRPTARPT